MTKLLSFIGALALYGSLCASAVWAAPTIVVSGIPGPATTIFTEQVGGTDAHVVQLTTPGTLPNYKWQFLTGGTRVFIDRKDGFGFIQLISQIQTAPEYMKQQGTPGNFVWNSYGLSISTTGANVLQGFDRQNQTDGSVKMIRSYSTFEEGIAESLTETWVIPKTAEDLANKGPKVSYSMTKNRGIILTKGVQEGTWRMRWALSGIANITADTTDIKDGAGWPIRRKSYSNNEFAIDVDDFDNIANDINSFSFSEVAANNKAEILFFKNGTTGDRIIDPTIITGNIAQAWIHNQQRNTFYNGTNFFVFYNKGSTSLFAKGASSIANLPSATEQIVLDAEMSSNTFWNIYLVDDSKFDLVYEVSGTVDRARTCTLSGTTISCGTASSITTADSAGADVMSVGRTPSADRVWVSHFNGGGVDVFSAIQTGDVTSSTTWTNEGFAGPTAVRTGVTLIPYGSSDKTLNIFMRDPGGSVNDGLYYTVCTRAAGCTSSASIAIGQTLTEPNFGSGIRITSDTDFRFVYVDASATTNLIEAKFDGSTTWTTTTNIDTGGGQKNPALFYDRTGDKAYVFYTDSATPNSIQRYEKATASTYGNAWTTKTDVDAAEGDANSLPVTQMHEPPTGSSRTTPRELTWCYRNANVSNFDVVCGNLNLAAAAATAPDIEIRGGTEIRGGVNLR